MGFEVTSLQCKCCGAPLAIDFTECDHCGTPIIIRTFNSVQNMPMQNISRCAMSYAKDVQSDPNNIDSNKAAAYCYLKLGMYDNAHKYFEKAVIDNFDDSEIYFYAAISLLNGNKAFLLQRPIINKIEEYLNAATMIESRGIYYYLWAYIKYDYYERKYLITNPNYKAMLNSAYQFGISPADISELFSILKVQNPF